NEALPAVSAAPSAAAAATAAATAAPATAAQPVARVVAAGELQFVDSIHNGMGPVQLVALGDPLFVRIDGVALTNAPDVHVYLAEDAGGEWADATRPYLGPVNVMHGALNDGPAAGLAAQAQDERINQVTRGLFKKYRTAADYAAAPPGELERDIKATGFYNQKAKALRAMARGLLDGHGGEVPSEMDALTKLHGVGRKTASIVLGAAFGIPSVAVDRHVARVAGRLRLSRATDPDRIEEDLRGVYPKKDWVRATWCLVLHGRRICRPTPVCPECPVIALCPYPKKTKPPR